VQHYVEFFPLLLRFVVSCCHCPRYPLSYLAMMWKIVGSAAAFCSLAAAYSPLVIKNLNTHQPNGNPAGQTNYYRIQFDVSSSNGGAESSATCQTSWGDNSWLQTEAYSMAVPTGKWIACGANDFRFQLFPYFSIGNFSLGVQQNFTDST
jgi:hypothetical protein